LEKKLRLCSQETELLWSPERHVWDVQTASAESTT
jgi:hypothetical protein